MPRTAKRARYHHGDLRNALIDTAIELIGERGVAGFSLAEASRRLGVTAAAPYRHFADREALLAAVAVRAAEALSAAVTAETRHAATPAEQLAAAARGYVRFAATHRPLFHALLGAGLDKRRHPEIGRAARPATDALLTPARALCGDEATARELALAIAATAHGHAALLLDTTPAEGGQPGEPGEPGGVDAAAARAATATLALVRGRGAFRPARPPRPERR